MLSAGSLVKKLEAHYGVSEWWPGESRFEVAVGAILTQRTSWRNALTAIRNLKSEGALTPRAICACEVLVLERLVRPSGFFRQKARYLRSFSTHLVERYDGDMELMRRRQLDELRCELLMLDGIGPETADSILLYALELPSFVVDAYSFRLLSRMGMYSGRDYGRVKGMFESSLGLDAKRLSSAHAAIVNHCKEHCKARPACEGCPLRRVCPSESHQQDEHVPDH